MQVHDHAVDVSHSYQGGAAGRRQRSASALEGPADAGPTDSKPPITQAHRACMRRQAWRAEIRDVGGELRQVASSVSHHLVAEQRADPLVHPHAVTDTSLTQRRRDEESGLTSWGDLIQARARSSHPAGWPGTQAPARRSLLPASQPAGLLPCCLCTNMWITCAQRRRACAYEVEMLGIPLPGRSHNRAFTWESASRILCIQRKPELSTCHPAIDNK